MKRVFLLLVVSILAISLVACSSITSSGEVENSNKGSATVSNDQNNSSKTIVKDNNSFDASAVSNKIEVKGETYSTSFSNYLFLILTNNSGVDCDVSVAVDFFDSSDGIVGTQSETVEAFAAGTTVAVQFYCDDEFAKYEYEVTAKELSYYSCIDQNLNCEVSTASDKAIISVTNTGDEVAEYVQYHALFYKNDDLVSSDWGYVVDDDSQIKSGATQKTEAHCYDDFDSVTVYLHGRSETHF